MPGCCGADVSGSVSSYGGDVWSNSCIAKAASLKVCKDTAGDPLPGLVWPKDVTPGTETTPGKYLLGAGGAVLRVDGTGAGATVSGWACDPEWSGGSTRVRIYAGYVREDERTHFITEVRADRALVQPLANEVSAACDGPNRGYAWHGFSASLAGWNSAMGNLFVYAVDEATSDGPAAPPTLLRNGIVKVPTCEHPETVAGVALTASCSACAGQVCAADTTCCSGEWDGECVARAAACTAGTRSTPTSAYAFTEVATGSIEPPVSGNYAFASAGQPSRLWINGQKVLDWGPWPREAGDSTQPTTQGQIVLSAGTRYHIRWDRLQAEPSTETTGLTWRLPGTSELSAIPRARALQRRARRWPGALRAILLLRDARRGRKRRGHPAGRSGRRHQQRRRASRDAGSGPASWFRHFVLSDMAGGDRPAAHGRLHISRRGRRRTGAHDRR